MPLHVIRIILLSSMSVECTSPLGHTSTAYISAPMREGRYASCSRLTCSSHVKRAGLARDTPPKPLLPPSGLDPRGAAQHQSTEEAQAASQRKKWPAAVSRRGAARSYTHTHTHRDNNLSPFLSLFILVLFLLTCGKTLWCITVPGSAGCMTTRVRRNCGSDCSAPTGSHRGDSPQDKYGVSLSWWQEAQTRRGWRSDCCTLDSAAVCGEGVLNSCLLHPSSGRVFWTEPSYATILSTLPRKMSSYSSSTTPLGVRVL